MNNSRAVVSMSLGLAAVLMSANAFCGAAKAKRPVFVIPKCAKAPVIDGKMAPGEWDRAAAMSTFIGATGSFGRVMVPKRARIDLCHDGKTIYIAVWTELAPGEKPSMMYRRRDSKCYMDRQQFEVWLTPPTDGQITAYQLIGNAYGALYDIKIVPALGVKQPGWNPNVRFKNNYKVGEHWTAELAIPISELIDKDAYNPKKPWGGMIAVAWPQRSWPYTFGWYKNIETHAQMHMAETDTCVRVTDMQSLFAGKLEPKMTLVNGEKADAEFSVSASVGQVKHEARYSVPAGQTKEVSFSKELGKLDSKSNTLAMTVTGPGGRTLLDGEWYFRQAAIAKRAPKPAPPWGMSTRLAYAPLAMGAHAWADLLDYPGLQKLKNVRFTVKDAKAGKVVLQKEVSEYQYDAAEAYLWMPKDLAYGVYQVDVEFIGRDGSVLEKKQEKFKHKDYKKEFIWLGSDKYGEKLNVSPPFTPLETKGNAFHVWGREYQMKGALPEQVVSQKASMLAGPVNFVSETGGKAEPAKVEGAFQIAGKPDGNEARFAGRYKVAGMTLELTGHILFDGAITYELKASVGKAQASVDRLYLSIPVKDEHAMYYWSTRGGGGSAHGIFSERPKKEGVVWDSAPVSDFVPYVGIADDDRAIQWFADNDFEWVRGKDAPCAQIVRKGGATEIQVNLIRKKGVVKPFKATFGLIATPIKPLAKDWRNAILHYGNDVNSDVAFFYGPGHGKVGPVDWHDSAALAKANGIAIPKGKKADEVLDQLSGEGYPNVESIGKVCGAKCAREWIRPGLATNKNPKLAKRCYFHNAQMYFEGNRSKAFRTFFKGDWTLNPPSGWFHLRPVESYQDFFCFHLTQFLKFWAVPGLYFDETYFAPDRNVFNGQGRLMPDGTIRPSVGLTLQRRFLNRVRQCCLDQKIPPFLWVHTSNIMAPYAISAVDIAMFGEDNLPTPQQDIMDNIRPQYMRVLGMSRKFGFIPVWMTMAGRGGEQWTLAGRQTFGWCWLHDTVPEYHTHARARPAAHLRKAWGIGAEDVSFVPYWKNDSYMKVDDGKFLVSIWRRPGGKQMLIVMNMHYREDKKTKVSITLDSKALGLKQGWKAWDLESTPNLLTREKALQKADADTLYGARRLGKSGLTGGDKPYLTKEIYASAWKKEVKEIQREKLQVVSDGKASFTLEVPARDFRLLIVE